MKWGRGKIGPSKRRGRCFSVRATGLRPQDRHTGSEHTADLELNQTRAQRDKSQHDLGGERCVMQVDDECRSSSDDDE